MSILAFALAIAGCYDAHERSGGGSLCGPPLGHVCCLPSGLPAGVAPQECPFVCPPGTELLLEAACVPGPRDAGPRPDARPPTGDAAVHDAGLPPGCAPHRGDSTCLESFLAPPGVPFTLPVTLDTCGCCPGSVCGARADPDTQSLHLDTALCADLCDCDACFPAIAECAIPALAAGLWNVVVNGAPAFELPVFEDSGVVPPPPACVSYAAPDPCASDVFIDPIPRTPSRVCVRDDVNARSELVVTHECLGCSDLAGPCTVALEPRFTDDLPPGGELHVLETTHTFECDIDCPEVCERHERVCELPPLVPGDFYRVWMEGALLTTFVAGSPPPCETDPIPPG